MASSCDTSQSIRWIWLSEDVNMDDLDLYGQTLEDESQLRKSLGFLKYFTNVDECVDYITDVQDTHIVLTISGRFARHVIPHIHDFSQLEAVYISCKPENKERNKEWSAYYFKVKAIISQTEEYMAVIYRNHIKSYVEMKNSALRNSSILIDTNHERFHGMTPFNVFDSTGNTYKDLLTENGNFVWMQLLIEVLIHLNPSKSAMDEFRRMCHEFIKRHNKDCGNVFIFISVYDYLNPIKWYTKEPFVYRFLNEILRSGDIDKLILLRMLVRDINNQLKEEHRKFVESSITVYRGQAMKLTELQYLQKHPGHFISMNSFLSTSRDRQIAMMYAETIDKSDDNLQSVLLEINCDTVRLDMKPFADISHLSCFENEKEVLFMLGSVFRVQNIYQDETNELWFVKMTLCGKNDYDFGNAFQSIRNDMTNTPSLTSLGLIFQSMGDFRRATQCFQEHLNLLEDEDDTTRSACYHNLGNMATANGNYDKALDYLKKSMKIRLKVLPTEKFIMGALYNDIGAVYDAKKDHERALEYYEKALSSTLESVGENHKQSAMIYGNIGDNYHHQNKYDLALNNLNKSLEILTNLHFKNRPEFVRTLGDIGKVYSLKGDHSTALLLMSKALDIERKILPDNHVKLAISYNNIGSLYAEVGKLDLALYNYNLAQRIFQVALPIDHPNTQAVTKNIETIKTRIDER
ncbi:unnamed protein product [Rotaria sp. Silwood1]|nr:unnamed protein product [Rotaria sp. Silwood1]